ncbi:hypothetical protein RCIX842 [Methanocella arvoryzae MRE50]|uniref:Uncharacterized protein n=2 Tax=Methanocella TaxID=570266 RepID=Q0W5Y7_METAR|nr:hypothetical protein RCIX842 [Methanocella arvoryzae MRE50]
MGMRERTFVGKVLFRRESLVLDVLHRYRSSRMLLFMAAIIIAGCVLVIAFSQIALLLPGDMQQSGFYMLVVSGLAGLFIISALVAILGERRTTVITDAGILYGDMFQRWPEIRCCEMRKTRRGLIVWIRTRKRIRMYFRGRDSEIVEKLFRSFCRKDAFDYECA